MTWLKSVSRWSCIAMGAITLISSPVPVFAADNAGSQAYMWHGHGPLVALGDSITYGYNLGNNKQPSRKAFPYLMGAKLKVKVADLGVPGWTSAELLNAVQHNSAMRKQIQHAGVITIDIGSNDLLQTAFGNGQAIKPQDIGKLETQLTTTVQVIGSNVNEILATVRKLNAHADIVVYNLYNPISPSDEAVHELADFVEQATNLALAQDATAHGATLADAYDALHDYQADILKGDVHPTAKGQALLAKQGESALDVLQLNQSMESPSGLQAISTWFNSLFGL